MRCDECKHWKVSEADARWNGWSQRWVGFGECAAVRERWRVMEDAVRDKGREDFVSEGDWDTWDDTPPPAGSYTALQLEALKASRAVVQDGSDYHAELLTAPDFFCALFAQVDRNPEGENAEGG